MKKWGFLLLSRSDYKIYIRSTDPDEVATFCEMLKKRFADRVLIYLSPDLYCAEFWGRGVVHNLLRDSTKKKPYIADVYYSLIISARERGWEPYEGFGKFIRYYSNQVN